MLLTQGFVLLGEKGLTFQTDAAHRAHEAGVMPGKAQRLQKQVSSLDGEVASTADGAKESIVVRLTVGLSVLQMKDVITNRFSTGHAGKAGNMPSLFQSIDDFPKDLPLAPATLWGEEFLIAQLTVQGPPLLHEADVGHGVFAVSTVKLFRVPRLAQGHQERSPDDLVAVGTHGCALPGRDVLCSLHQRVLLTARWRLAGPCRGRPSCS